MNVKLYALIFLAGATLATSSQAADELIISEFMAANSTTLRDDDGDYSDWIELYNRGTNAVNLLDWALTDNASNLSKWLLPATNLASGKFLVVFASNKDRRLASAPLHTNFKLSSSGGYLALVRPDHLTVASQFSPTYPSQVPDVSFGFSVQLTSTALVPQGAPLRVLVPANGSLGLTWTQPGFNDGGWSSGANAVGFDTGAVDPNPDSGAGAIVDSQPLAYFRMSESNGTNALNSGTLGAAANARYLGGALLQQAGPRPTNGWAGFEPENTAVRCNGVDGRIQVPDHAAFDFGTGPYTIEFWFNATNPTTRGDLFTYKGAAGDYGIHLSSSTARSISVYHDAFIGTGGVVGTNQWHHLVVVRDAASLVRGFLDGLQILSGSDPRSMNIAADLVVGANHTGSPASPTIPFAGSLDEVAIYNRALTTNEIANHYRSAATPANVPFAGSFGTDLQSVLYGINSSAYLRIPFVVSDPSSLSRLLLNVRYDDGFVAFINGQEVGAANAPATPAWNSVATSTHSDSAALSPVTFDQSDARDFLHPGTNILALHGLNVSADNPDFLLGVELTGISAGQFTTEPRYFTQPTPGSVNGQGEAEPGPIIAYPQHTPALPSQPRDQDDIIVTARVVPSLHPVSTVTLVYQVMYGSTNRIPMSDDGLHGDSAAGDGIYGALIPAAAATPGQMVRWFITAADDGGRTTRWPLFEDPLGSPEFLGTVVATPDLTNSLPVFEWFAQNAAAGLTRTGTRSSVFFNGEFFDNVFVRVRGSATTVGQKFDFNRGAHIKMNDEVGRVEEVNLNGIGSDPTYLRPPLAFETFRLAGNAASHSFHILMRRNGGADRVGIYVEQPDDEYLQRNGLDPEGALYKFDQRANLNPIFSDATDGVQKRTRQYEDNSDLQGLVDGLKLPTEAARMAYFFDNVNVPQLINFLAVRALNMDSDDARKNMYMYRDTRGNREWSILPWDKDWTYGIEGDGGTFLHHPFFADQFHAKQNANQYSVLWTVVFNNGPTREMYLRRLRTLMDEFLQPPGTPAAQGWFEGRVDQWFQSVSNAIPGLAANVSALKAWFPTRRTDLFVTYAATNISVPLTNRLIPAPQPANAIVALGAIEFNPASGNQAEEFIGLTNASGFAVDISGWSLDGAVRHTFQPGTVILATNVLYVSPDVNAFRARTSGPRGGLGLAVQGNYQGQLSARGETVELRDRLHRLVKALAYAPSPSPAQQYLRITEFMYNPAPWVGSAYDAQELEYLELRNIGPGTLDLHGIRLTNGVDFSFSAGAITSLGAGQRILVVKNLTAFQAYHGSLLNVAGQYVGALANSGERLQLLDATGEEILDFSYNNAWHPITDGHGFSLIVVDEQALPDTWNDRFNWRPSAELGGSPGTSESPALTLGPVYINEVLSRTDLPPPTDTVELYNPTTAPINISGWFLSDDFNTPKKFLIPTNTIILAGGYVSFTEAQFNPAPNVPPSFAFSSLGDEVWLFSADASHALTGYVHGFGFGAADDGVSFGRYSTSSGAEHFVALNMPTLGATNAAPKVGPVIINEIMYHPPSTGSNDDTALEFIELLNVSATPVNLSSPDNATNSWKVTEGVDYVFPPGVTLNAGEYLLLVHFDPANNATQLASFRNRYGVAGGVQILGPYRSELANAGERIELKKPTTAQQSEVPYVLVDEVDYQDVLPWPGGADGFGLSLQRRSRSGYGNDSTNWVAAPSTAAGATAVGAPPVITVQPVSQSMLGYGSGSLSVQASGVGPLRYQWRFNGENLASGTNSILPLPNIQSSQAGTYEVVVYNAAASVLSARAEVTVLLPASILNAPQSVAVRPGSNVTFNVQAYSPFPLTYQWRLNGFNIVGATNVSLSITNVKVADGGDYAVLLTDEVGPVLSAAARLSVLVEPVIVQQPLTTRVPAGGTVTLSIGVTNTATLPIGYRWRRNGTTVLSNALNSRVAFLTVTNVQSSNVYSVVVANLASVPPGFLSSSATVDVLPDRDHDGLPDAFETAQNLNPDDPADAAADADGDTMTNLAEFIAGTDPHDPTSYLRVETVDAGLPAFLEFIAVSNRTYGLEYTESLSPRVWQPLAGIVARSTNRVERILDPAPSPTRFYRLVTPKSP